MSIEFQVHFRSQVEFILDPLLEIVGKIFGSFYHSRNCLLPFYQSKIRPKMKNCCHDSASSAKSVQFQFIYAALWVMIIRRVASLSRHSHFKFSDELYTLVTSDHTLELKLATLCPRNRNTHISSVFQLYEGTFMQTALDLYAD